MAEEFRKDWEPEGRGQGDLELGPSGELENAAELEGDFGEDSDDGDASGAILSGDDEPVGPPPLCARRRGGPRRKHEAEHAAHRQLSPQERLLVLDIWQRSGLPAGDFAPLVGLSSHTLYGWKRRFAEEGPSALMDRLRGPQKGSKLPELTPPRTPRYNGAIESGMRWMKERTEHVALSAGHPGEWRAEDLEMAKRLTNDLPRKADPRPASAGGLE